MIIIYCDICKAKIEENNNSKCVTDQTFYDLIVNIFYSAKSIDIEDLCLECHDNIAQDLKNIITGMCEQNAPAFRHGDECEFF
jgi:hypothetical protein